MAISYTPVGSGPDAGGIGWINFGSVTFDPGAAAANVTEPLNDVTNDSGTSDH